MTPAEIRAEVDTFDDAHWVTHQAGRTGPRVKRSRELTETEAKELLREYWHFMSRLLRNLEPSERN